jgi:hypothetical protein
LDGKSGPIGDDDRPTSGFIPLTLPKSDPLDVAASLSLHDAFTLDLVASTKDADLKLFPESTATWSFDASGKFGPLAKNAESGLNDIPWTPGDTAKDVAPVGWSPPNLKDGPVPEDVSGLFGADVARAGTWSIIKPKN